jgi:hypothetical protein
LKKALGVKKRKEIKRKMCFEIKRKMIMEGEEKENKQKKNFGWLGEQNW